MPQTKQYYQGLFQEMLDEDSKRDAMYRSIDAMFHNVWDLPQPLRKIEWIRKVVSTDPSDALRTATRVLSTVAPKFYYQPLYDNVATKDVANNIERAIDWNFKQASRRRARVERSLVASCLRYDMAAANVVDLDHQFKALTNLESHDARRVGAARRYGKYAITVHNPQYVHARWSDLFLEAVLLAKVMPAQRFVDFWGKSAAQKIIEAAGGADQLYEYSVSVYDYTDLEDRVVLAFPHPHGTLVTPKSDTGAIEILREPHEMSFIPWAIREGGETLDHQAEYQVSPLLGSVYQTDAWDTQNIALSLMMSEVIAYSAAPRMAIRKMSGETIEIDYGEVNRPIELGPGDEIIQLSPPIYDQNLQMVIDRFSSQMNKSTVARFLQNLDFPSGTAFATINAVIQSAANALDPYKSLGEEVIGEVGAQMMYWSDYTDTPLIGYGTEKSDKGKQYVVKPGEDFDVDQLYLSAKLTTHVPTDYLQRINAAVMMAQNLKMPVARVLEDLDITDPETALLEYYSEQMDEAAFQQLQQQIQMAQQQAQLAAQQAQMPQQPQGTGEGNLPSFDNIGGQSFNPAFQGEPPVEGAPLTREQVTGRDRQGMPLQEL